jgi:hypothetical protein
MMDWVILTFGIIFGAIGLYLLSLWRRARQTDREAKQKLP